MTQSPLSSFGDNVAALPEGWREIGVRTAALGFDMPSEADTGALLRLLAAAKPGGRLLELGTGTGLATACLLAGMDAGATLISLDNDAEVQAVARDVLGDDPRVNFVLADAMDYIRAQRPGAFDLIFADAWPGKYDGLDETLALLAPRRALCGRCQASPGELAAQSPDARGRLDLASENASRPCRRQPALGVGFDRRGAPAMIWIPITIGAAALQVARNAAQRSVMGGAGPWGATLVRFLFGLPFATVFAVVAWVLTPGARAHPSAWFWLACAAGAAAQMSATAAQLVAMHRSTFALGTAMQQSGLPFALIWGATLSGDHISPLTWAGGLVASAGLAALTWPRGEVVMRRGAALAGLGAGALFALSANCFRQASLTLDPAHHVASAFVTVMVVQAIQTVVLTGFLAARNPAALTR